MHRIEGEKIMEMTTCRIISNFTDLKYYYFRDAMRHPGITVCLLKVGEQTSRGIAICGGYDQPNKKIGRAIAKGRAFKAMFDSRSSCRVRSAFVQGMKERWKTDYLYKAVYMPALTDFEYKLLFGVTQEEMAELSIKKEKNYIRFPQYIQMTIDDKIRMQLRNAPLINDQGSGRKYD
jgi:hypothetical protein